MSFLFALFGCIWLAHMYQSHKSQIQKNEIRDERIRTTTRDFWERYIDADREHVLRDRVMHMSMMELYDLLEPDLMEMFGFDYKAKFPFDQKLGYKQKSYLPSCSTLYPNPNVFHAIELLLSREGKISMMDSGGFRLQLRQGNETDIAVYRQIERNIRKLGHDFTLVDKTSYTDLTDPMYCRSTTVGYTLLVPDYLAITDEHHRWWDDD